MVRLQQDVFRRIYPQKWSEILKHTQCRRRTFHILRIELRQQDNRLRYRSLQLHQEAFLGKRIGNADRQ